MQLKRVKKGGVKRSSFEVKHTGSRAIVGINRLDICLNSTEFTVLRLKYEEAILS